MSSGSSSLISIASRPDIVRRSVRVALLVGTILALINHGDRLVAGNLDLAAATKIILTYLVPYSVATWAAVQTVRESQIKSGSQEHV
ncbi:MAG: nitrate/nitrite transporter NrtS [Pseudomonadales bacterium]